MVDFKDTICEIKGRVSKQQAAVQIFEAATTLTREHDLELKLFPRKLILS